MRTPIFSEAKYSLVSLLILLLMVVILPLELWAQIKEVSSTNFKDEIVNNTLRFKTQKYITSGGLQYMPNDNNGDHSPFMYELLRALRSYGGQDGVLTLSEIHDYLSNLKTEPDAGALANNEIGSDLALSQGGYDGGKIYALVIGNSIYDEWSDLENPVIDADAVAEELKNDYEAEVEVIKNVSKNEFVEKLREYSQMSFSEKDQLVVIYAGHGEYDDVFGEGYLIMRDSKKEDHVKLSQVSHTVLRTIIRSIPSRHTLLIMDASIGRIR